MNNIKTITTKDVLKKASKVISHMIDVHDGEPWHPPSYPPRYYKNCYLDSCLHPWLFFPRHTSFLGVVVLPEDETSDDLNNFYPIPVLTLLRIGYKLGPAGEIIVKPGFEYLLGEYEWVGEFPAGYATSFDLG